MQPSGLHVACRSQRAAVVRGLGATGGLAVRPSHPTLLARLLLVVPSGWAPCAQCAGGRARHTAVSPTRPLRSLDARRAQRPGIVRGIGRVGGLAMSNGRPCAQWSGGRGCRATVSPARPSRSPVARSAQRSGVMLLGRAGSARACAGAVPSVVLLAYRSSCPVIGRRQQKCCVLNGRASLSVGRYAMPLVRRTAVSPASCFPYAAVERAGVCIERECSPCGWFATRPSRQPGGPLAPRVQPLGVVRRGRACGHTGRVLDRLACPMLEVGHAKRALPRVVPTWACGACLSWPRTRCGRLVPVVLALLVAGPPFVAHPALLTRSLAPHHPHSPSRVPCHCAGLNVSTHRLYLAILSARLTGPVVRACA